MCVSQLRMHLIDVFLQLVQRCVIALLQHKRVILPAKRGTTVCKHINPPAAAERLPTVLSTPAV